MKMRTAILTVLVIMLAGICVLTSCTKSGAPEHSQEAGKAAPSTSEQEPHQAATKLIPAQAESQEECSDGAAFKAATWGVPIVAMYALRYDDAFGPKPKAPPNTLWRMEGISTPKLAQEAGYVLPDMKTIYGLGFLDLGQQPVILTLPNANGRFYSVEVFDMWTNAFAFLGGAEVAYEGGDFAMVGPGWKGTLPQGAKRIDCPRWVLIQPRIHATNEKDLPNARKVLQAITVQGLAEYRGEPAPSAPEYKYAAPTFVNPKLPVGAMDFVDPLQFWEILSAAMNETPPPEDQVRILMATFQYLDLELGKQWDRSKVDPVVLEEMKQAVQKLPSTLLHLPVGKMVNGWSTPSTLDADSQYMLGLRPTHLPIMHYRLVELHRAARGLACSLVPLVAFDGMKYRPAAWAEDPGLHLLVPELARSSGLSIETAYDVFLAAATLLASTVGLLGFLLTAQTPLGRRVGIAVFVLVLVVAWRQSDVYMLGAMPAVACVSWIMFFVSRKRVTAGMLTTMAMVGLVAQTANFVRSHSGTGLMLFALLVAAGVYQLRLASRIVLIVTLLLGVAGAALLFQHFVAQRDAFLERQPQTTARLTNGHPLWHNVYLGLSYVNNSEVSGNLDSVAEAKAQELRPGTEYSSPEYEQILRDQVLELVKRRPFFIVETLLLKLTVVGLFCLGAASPGLYATRLARKPVLLEMAFWLAIGFYALPGILVRPSPRYILGSIVFAAMYGAYSVENAARNEVFG